MYHNCEIPNNSAFVNLISWLPDGNFVYIMGARHSRFLDVGASVMRGKAIWHRVGNRIVHVSYQNFPNLKTVKIYVPGLKKNQMNITT